MRGTGWPVFSCWRCCAPTTIITSTCRARSRAAFCRSAVALQYCKPDLRTCLSQNFYYRIKILLGLGCLSNTRLAPPLLTQQLLPILNYQRFRKSSRLSPNFGVFLITYHHHLYVSPDSSGPDSVPCGHRGKSRPQYQPVFPGSFSKAGPTHRIDHQRTFLSPKILFPLDPFAPGKKPPEDYGSRDPGNKLGFPCCPQLPWPCRWLFLHRNKIRLFEPTVLPQNHRFLYLLIIR